MFLLGLNGNEQWIGLDDGWGDGVFLWSNGRQLVSGDARWTDNEPNNNYYQEHCVLLEGTTWKHWNCEEEKVFTCEKMPQGFLSSVLKMPFIYQYLVNTHSVILLFKAVWLIRYLELFNNNIHLLASG